MENAHYLAGGLLAIAGLLVVEKAYQSRWSLLDRGIDAVLDLRRFLRGEVAGKQIFSDSEQMIVTEIQVRRFEDRRSMAPVDSHRRIIDIHLGGSTGVDLSAYVPNGGENLFVLVDVTYHSKGHKFVLTVPYQSEAPLATLSNSSLAKGHCQVYFEEIEIVRDGRNIELEPSFKRLLVEQVNRYLGPLNDFHYGLSAIRSEWMDLKGFLLRPGDRLVLTTELMETLELEHGEELRNSL
jgi:hypothetical protein